MDRCLNGHVEPLLTSINRSSYPTNGSQKLIDIEDERKLRIFMEKRVRLFHTSRGGTRPSRRFPPPAIAYHYIGCGHTIDG